VAHLRVLIVGGGAAGLCAAVAAARLGSDVTLIEAGPRVGKKILASGNGRCNLTNLAVVSAAYNAPGFVAPVLVRHGGDAIRRFFGDMGLLTCADTEGRVYPTTNVANSVLDVLRLECERLGVEERCEHEAVHLNAPAGTSRVSVTLAGGETLAGDALVVTTGGGNRLLAGIGHQLVPCTPVLAPIATATESIRGLSGVRVRCAASLLGEECDVDSAAPGAPLEARPAVVATERGELLFRDYGVSGVMVFDLSRHLEGGRILSIDFFPEHSAEKLLGLLRARRSALGWRTAATFFDGMLQRRVVQAVLRAADVSAASCAAEFPCERLALILKDFRLPVVGVGDPRQAQVTRGGAALDGFDPHTMASHAAEGVFAAGEVLDVDGPCGGYNLHWAWVSGIVAGESAARFALGERPASG